MVALISTKDGSADQGTEPCEKALTTRPRKQVSFSPKATLRMVSKINKADPLANDIWYNRIDFQQFKAQDMHAVSALADKSNVSIELTGTDTCTRGLETRTGEGHRRKLDMRQSAWEAVFFQQDCYLSDIMPCPSTTIAAAYVECCKDAKEEARIRALNDEWYVIREVSKETEDTTQEKKMILSTNATKSRSMHHQPKQMLLNTSTQTRRIVAGQAA